MFAFLVFLFSFYGNDQRNILIVGDSEACAIAPFVKYVKKSNDVVDVSCKVSSTVQYWGKQHNLERVLKEKNKKYDHVIIFLGTNHYAQTSKPPVDHVLDVVKTNNMKCLWVGNTLVKGKKWRINKILRDAVTPTCSYFDTEAADIQLSDGVHPTSSGALKWIKSIWVNIV